MITISILVKNIVILVVVFKRIVWDAWGGVKMGVILKKRVCWRRFQESLKYDIYNYEALGEMMSMSGEITAPCSSGGASGTGEHMRPVFRGPI